MRTSGSVAKSLRLDRPLMLLLAAVSLSACVGSWRASFPTEEEVRAKLHRDMTAEQVLATFGEPPGMHRVNVERGGKVPYIAPVSARTRPVEGYAGFTVYFASGKVWDWEVILLNPSYEHRVLPGGWRSWQMRLVMLIVGGGSLFFAVRAIRNAQALRRALLRAYASRDIPADLPADFRFVTPETTVQAAMEQVGTPARKRTIRIRGNAAEAEAAISAFEYDLPDGSTVLVVPERSDQPESRIRAVVYRRANGAEQD